ncbi:MAG: ssDNA-binding domain-containing protein [Streptococcaceae bacterium]|nr:ssDNA-binding domain-containing protein [Streptococcaceae bacterium]
MFAFVNQVERAGFNFNDYNGYTIEKYQQEVRKANNMETRDMNTGQIIPDSPEITKGSVMNTEDILSQQQAQAVKDYESGILSEKSADGKKTLDQILAGKNGKMDAQDFKDLGQYMKDGISKYKDSETYKRYLDFAAKMPHYSSNNIRLILEQNPQAGRVAAYGKWKSLGRQVKKGERGLKIWALAVPPKILVDEKTGKPILDDKGNQKMTDPKFRLTTVFDENQTVGEPLPQLVYELTGDVNNFRNLFEALSQSTEAKVSFDSTLAEDIKGFYLPEENTIHLATGMSQEHTVKTLLHEMTHRELHSQNNAKFGDDLYKQQELEAESVAYVTAKHFGIDSSDYSFGYLNSWGLDNLSYDQLESTMKTVQSKANEMIKKIDGNLTKIKEKELNKVEQAKTVAKEKTAQQVAQTSQNSLVTSEAQNFPKVSSPNPKI